MERQELEELFPIGCVVSQDIKEKIGFGEWEKVWQYVFPHDSKFPKSMNNLPPKHILDINELPSHSFGEVAPVKPSMKPDGVHNYSYKRIG